MKRCPVCSAIAFDDQEVCYGCLHEFGEEERPSGFGEEDRPSESGQEGHPPGFDKEKRKPDAGIETDAAARGGAMSFVISFAPCETDDGKLSLNCRVEPS